VSLALPRPTLTPNIQAVGALCQDLSSGNCTQVGYVTARSPLYPSALTGQAYLTGNIAGLSLTLVFPAPFPLTLIGAVDLGKNATTFTGLPDIPLTDLTVSLGSGARGVFGTSCKSPSGTATATLTNQNGDKTVAVPAKFTIAGCPGHGGGKGGGTGGGNGAGRSTTIRVGRAFLAGLTTGHPSLGFRIAAAKGASRLRRIMVVLPHGLSFVRHRAGRRIVLTGIHVSGGRVASLTLSRGRLMITLHTATGGLTVSIGPRALAETAALKNQAVGGRINRLVLTLVTTNTAGKQSTLRVQFNHPGR
jgi:hypothetical protein